MYSDRVHHFLSLLVLENKLDTVIMAQSDDPPSTYEGDDAATAEALLIANQIEEEMYGSRGGEDESVSVATQVQTVPCTLEKLVERLTWRAQQLCNLYTGSM
jgi:hypothetical protein